MTLTDKDKELFVRMRLVGIRKDWCIYFLHPVGHKGKAGEELVEAFEAGRHDAQYFKTAECYLLPPGSTAEFDEAMK
jgi:hypothetical protein